MSNKPDMRRRLRAQRRALGVSARRTAAQRVARRGALLLRSARRVALYWPAGAELDTRPLRQALGRGRLLYLPAVARRAGRPLAFRAWQGRLVRGVRGTVEPRWGRPCPGTALDAVLLPVVGFDAQGWRLGQGGGHYDRTFAPRGGCARGRPLLIGLAYECQRLVAAPREAHDVRLHVVLTERRIYRGRRMTG